MTSLYPPHKKSHPQVFPKAQPKGIQAGSLCGQRSWELPGVSGELTERRQGAKNNALVIQLPTVAVQNFNSPGKLWGTV